MLCLGEFDKVGQASCLPFWLLSSAFFRRLEACATFFRTILGREPPDSNDIRGDLPGLLIEVGDFPAARAELNQVLESQPLGSVSARDETRQVTLLRWEQKPDKALAAAEKVLARTPGEPLALLMRGILRLERGELEQSRDDLLEVVRLSPHRDVAHFKLAEVYARLGNPELSSEHRHTSRRLVEQQRTIAELVRQAAGEPRNADVRWKLRDLFQARGQLDEARHWERAAKASERPDR